MSIINGRLNQNLMWKLAMIMCLIMSFGTAVAAENKIGIIKNVKGNVTIERAGDVLTAVPGLFLEERDIILTDSNSALGVIFKDNGILSVGPDSRLEIQDFTFIPVQKELSFVVSIIQGTLTYISGVITRLQPESVKFNTPSATVGIRGTHIAIKVAA